MIRTGLISTVLVVLIAFAGHAAEPEALVRSFYQPEVVSGFEPEVRDRFTKPATDIFKENDRLSGDGEIGCLDFALSIDGQDYDQAEIDRTLDLDAVVGSNEASVSAKFRQFPGGEGPRTEILWTLRKVGGDWKIADIASVTNDWRLSDFDCK